MINYFNDLPVIHKNASELLESLDLADRESLVSLTKCIDVPIVLMDHKKSGYTLSFRKHNEQIAFISRLQYASLISHYVLKSFTPVSPLNILNQFIDLWSLYYDFLGFESIDDFNQPDTITIQLNEQHTSLSDVDYIEFHSKDCNSDPSVFIDYFIRFHFKAIQPSYTVEHSVSVSESNKKITYQKVCINVAHDNHESILIPFLNTYKEELSQNLGHPVEKVDESVLKLVEILIF